MNDRNAIRRKFQDYLIAERFPKPEVGEFTALLSSATIRELDYIEGIWKKYPPSLQILFRYHGRKRSALERNDVLAWNGIIADEVFELRELEEYK